jgi:hypothetical protein
LLRHRVELKKMYSFCGTPEIFLEKWFGFDY